jgi:ferredoxin
MKIKIDRDLCIGAGTCAALAPNTFELDSELKAVLKKDGKKDSDENIIAAARGCPVCAIILEGEKGKKIYP